MAVPVDARGDWPLADSTGPAGIEFPVLDHWFVSRTGGGRGVAAPDGTPTRTPAEAKFAAAAF